MSLQSDAPAAGIALTPTTNGVTGCRDGGRAPIFVDGEVEVEEDYPGEITEEYPPDNRRNFIAPHATMMDVQRENGQGAGARHEAN